MKEFKEKKKVMTKKMTVKRMIKELSKFPGKMEVVLIIDRPEESPRKITGIVADDFDEHDTVAILTKMKEA